MTQKLAAMHTTKLTKEDAHQFQAGHAPKLYPVRTKPGSLPPFDLHPALYGNANLGSLRTESPKPDRPTLTHLNSLMAGMCHNLWISSTSVDNSTCQPQHTLSLFRAKLYCAERMLPLDVMMFRSVWLALLGLAKLVQL